jgi:hypothetical protein
MFGVHLPQPQMSASKFDICARTLLLGIFHKNNHAYAYNFNFN